MTEHEDRKVEADTRRKLYAMAEQLSPVLDTAGWPSPAKELRAALLQCSVSYPDLQDEEFAALADALENILPYIIPDSHSVWVRREVTQ